MHDSPHGHVSCSPGPSPSLQVGAYGYLGLIPRWLQEGVGGKGALGRTIQQLLLADGDGEGCAVDVARVPSAAGERGVSAELHSDPHSAESIPRRSPPLLAKMALDDASDNLPFRRALSSFQRRICYANAVRKQPLSEEAFIRQSHEGSPDNPVALSAQSPALCALLYDSMSAPSLPVLCR